MSPQPLIEIITPAYNVEPYIDEFFQSLLAQDYQNWRVLARDDGSSDGTVKKLEAWQQHLGEKLRIIPNPGSINLGARGSFSLLFTLTTAPWVACGDSDDIWLPNRLSATYTAAAALAAEHGSDMPLLVSADAYIVDDRLNRISDSVWSWQGLDPGAITSFPRMLMDHPVLGATTLANRRAVEKAFPLPSPSIDHDWWLGLVVSSFGVCKILPEKTMLYRRHGQNTSALPLTTSPLMALSQITNWKTRLNKIMNYVILQARAFENRFAQELSPAQKQTLHGLIALSNMSWAERKITIIRRGLWFTSWRKNMVYWTLI